MFLALGPDHEDVGKGRVGNPRLGAGNDVVVAVLLRPGFHPRRVRACVRLGQAEAADQRAGGKPGEVFAALLVRAIGIDRVHHEARLHARHRAVAAVDAFDLAGDEAIGDIARPRAAEFLRYGGTEQSGGPHQREQLGRVDLLAEGVDHARLEFGLREAVGGIADHPLFFGELAFEVEGVFPVERRDTALGGGGAMHGVAPASFVALRLRRLGGPEQGVRRSPERAPPHRAASRAGRAWPAPWRAGNARRWHRIPTARNGGSPARSRRSAFAPVHS